MRQLTLLREKKYKHRKVARAISLRGANHVVLKSARPVLRKHQARIRGLVRETQDRFGIRLRAIAVMPDHVHLSIKVDRREQLANALRFLCGAVALKVAKGRLWRARARSRPLKTLGEIHAVDTYIARNTIKAGLFTRDDGYFILGGVLQI